MSPFPALLALALAVSGASAFAECQTPGPATLPLPPPRFLSKAGLFGDLGTLQPCDGLIEYEINSPLWADGAQKRRWISLPRSAAGDREKIRFAARGAWTFPIGTVIVMHFDLEVAPATKRRLQTLLLARASEEEWSGFAYQWSANQKDALLLPDAADFDLEILDGNAPGGKRKQSWHIPSREECLDCHTPLSGTVLGVRTEQINVGNQLDLWNAMGMFSVDIGKASNYLSYPNPRDGSRSLSERARSYLAANCAHCHQPGGPVPTTIDLRYETSMKDTRTVNARPLAGGLGIPNPLIIRPKKKELSVLWKRMRTLGISGMPPESGNLDMEGSALIGAWIDREIR